MNSRAASAGSVPSGHSPAAMPRDQAFELLVGPRVGGPDRGSDRGLIGGQRAGFHQHPAGLGVLNDVGGDRGGHGVQDPAG